MMEKGILQKNLGRIVSITLNDGQILIGQLVYAPSYRSRMGFMMPESYYIGKFSFKAEDVKILSVVWGE